MTERSASAAIHPVAVGWDVAIPARDGVRLSANVWRPTGSSAPARVPAILEMIPYGKDNWRRNADVAHGEYWAARGYALCRLDVRGTGSSGGIALDEYTEAETLDGYDAVEWLAAQPWSDGNIGMWGISYGGFTAIQVAKLRPPHLRAIAPLYATDDRYLDDVHLRGGCLVVSELSQYAVSQLAMNAMPPDAAFWGPDWKERWRDRLDQTPPWLLTWLRQQVDGPYWRQGSLAPEYDAIEAAVFHIAGWNDSYVDPAFRMQERCVGARSRRTLVGNWVHAYPSDAYPGPNLDWLHELTRFFDRHLKGDENGWDDEPGLVWFEREYAAPEPFPARWPGRWRAAAAYPVDGTATRSWAMAAGARLVEGDGVDDATVELAELVHRATAGTTGPLSWGAGSAPNGLARDGRPDEANGVTFTSDPLTDPVSILGVPVAAIQLAASMPVATLGVRLMDVAPDGTSSLVAQGVLNLTHRRSHASPWPLEPGLAETVEVPLRTSGYRWTPGHRIRLTLLSNLWPVTWPSPFPGALTIHGGSWLRLPVVPPSGVDAAIPAFRLEPPSLRAVGREGTEDPPEWRVEQDLLAGTTTVHIYEGGSTVLDDGRELYSNERLTMTTSDADPAHTRFATDVVYRWSTADARVAIHATGTIASDDDALDVDLAIEVDVDDRWFWGRTWHERVPRQLV
jgi:putative CocE/NonD family hydrolase